MKSFKMLMMAALTTLSVAVFAQDTTTQKMKTSKQNSEKVKYSCPMHPEEVSTKAGQCSKCGMDLTKSKKEQMKMEVKKTYSCPMKCEGDKTYDKPGKCPICGMNLTGSPKERMKMEVMKTYACPMHHEVTSNKPGKCSKCNMDLKEKNEDHSNHQH